MRDIDLQDSQPRAIESSTTASKAAQYLLEHNIEGCRVIENGAVVGIITKTSLMELIAQNRAPHTPVKDIMCKDRELLDTADELYQALTEYEEHIYCSGNIPENIRHDKLLWTFFNILKEKKKKWDAYFDAIYNPVVAVDREGKICLFNRAAANVMGMTQSQALGQYVNDLFSTSELIDVLKSGKIHAMRKLKTMGKTFFSNRTQIVVDDKIIGAISVLQEISAIEKAVQELETIKKLNKQLDTIFDSSYDGLYITDGEGITLRLNRAFERITGVLAEECVGRHMADLVKEGYFSRSGTLLALEKKHAVTITLKVRSGKTVLVTSTPIFDDNNNIILVVTNVRDMTELWELERKLENVEVLRQKELQAIFESSFDGLYITDGEGYTLKLNKAFERITGVTAEECMGRNMADLVKDGIFSRSGTLLALEKRHPVTITLQVRTGKTVLVTSTPVFDEAGNIILVVTNVRDLTELTELERKLENVEVLRQKELNAIFESSYDGLYITDGQANTLRLNKAFERITGVGAEECVGRNMADLVREGIFSRSGSLLAIEKREPVTITLEVRSGKTVLVTSNPIFDDDGNIALVVTNVRDITELNELQSKLEHLEGLSRAYQAELYELKQSPKCIAQSRVMKDLLRLITQVAPVDSTILIQGESGVGKEVIADLLHSISNRKNKPFIKVNCAAIPHNLLESELFGYEPGAFTGASKSGKKGMFEIAHEGMLFLDEIGEMPLELQVKLLRVLQDNRITRIGGTQPIDVNVRVIAGTNRNLQDMVALEQFRKDLYYRLNVVPITVPPLRDRREDIPVLSKYFLDMFNRKYKLNKKLASDVVAYFMTYDWPGNVRELENLIERLVVTALKETITMSDLKLWSELPAAPAAAETELLPLPVALENTERRLLQKAFSIYRSTYKVASALGISQPTVVRKAAKYGITRNN
ncbi:MAG: sigma 54-interacting transcriptional regulator [Syntrophomonadaceae bacterium]|nr:sigma 54-interacting transcriptional regulator [Syntrophomonadaceae bacterium]